MKCSNHIIFCSILGFLLGNMALSAYATESVEIHIKDHQFVPKELRIPANTKVHLWVYNDDDTAEEFESLDFHREKIVMGKKKVKISIGPLKAGVYHFFGEFHPMTARGKLLVE